MNEITKRELIELIDTLAQYAAIVASTPFGRANGVSEEVEKARAIVRDYKTKEEV
jgi:hypothetical protein